MSDADRPDRPVEVVGAGLLGTSIALACRRAGLEVLLTDVARARAHGLGLGAGRARRPEDPRSWSWSRCPPTTSAARSRGAWRR